MARTTKTVTFEDDEKNGEQKEDLRCGYFSWKPGCLQICNTPPWLLASVCWFTFTQSKHEHFYFDLQCIPLNENCIYNIIGLQQSH